MNAKFLLCVLAFAMCSIVQETSAQYYGYSSYYPTYYGGYGPGAYNGYYGGAYGYGEYGYYGKREAGFGPTQQTK